MICVIIYYKITNVSLNRLNHKKNKKRILAVGCRVYKKYGNIQCIKLQSVYQHEIVFMYTKKVRKYTTKKAKRPKSIQQYVIEQ